jgi:uncharacterized protein (TIGR00255 family)
MTLSMTAFARAETETASGALVWELRSVNHRYLELAIKLPEELRSIEPQVREQVGGRLARGKVDCHLRLVAKTATDGEMRLDDALVGRVLELAQRIEDMGSNVESLRAVDVLRWPGALITAGLDVDALAKAAVALLKRALDELVSTRTREGTRLRETLESRLLSMREIVGRVQAITPQLVQEFRARLLVRLGELKQEVDPERLEQEIVLFAQRADVEEELDRLRTHLDEVQRVLTQGGPIGRRLDFLMQELNREANTLGSKAADIRLTNAAVDLKVLIEQMREQVQNIE